MYKIYHQEADDILSRTHINRLVEDTVHNVSEQLSIEVDPDLFKTEVRELSIDIMVAYKNTENTLSDSAEVRAELLRSLLEEFAIFRVFKPVQLNVRVIGDGATVDFDSGVGIGARSEEADLSVEQQDYSSFFSELHSLSRIEDDVRDSLDLFFTRRPDVEMTGAVVTSDDRVVFVSVIFRPTQRFAWLRFNKTSTQIKDELYRFIHERNEDLLGSQELVVKPETKSQRWLTAPGPVVSSAVLKAMTSVSWRWPNRTVWVAEFYRQSSWAIPSRPWNTWPTRSEK